MSLNAKALREGYDVAGMEVLVGALEYDQGLIVETLLQVPSTVQAEKLYDFQRGKYAAFQEVIDTIQDLLK